MKRKPALIPLLIAFLFLLVLGLQSGYCQLTEDPYILEQGIAYGMSEVAQLTLNIAIPKTDGVFPCIVYIGWGGVASYNTIAAITASEKGYVGVVVDYRRNAKFPIPIADLKCALSWLADNRARFKIDPKRIALAGFHFGGYIALMAAYTKAEVVQDSKCYGNSQNYKVVAVISLAAPTDWSKISDETYYNTLRGEDNKQDFFSKSCPLDYIDSQDPPTLIFHGEIDKDTPAIHAELLDKKLIQEGVPHKYVLLIDQDVHIMEQWQSDLAWEFLANYLK